MTREERAEATNALNLAIRRMENAPGVFPSRVDAMLALHELLSERLTRATELVDSL